MWGRRCRIGDKIELIGVCEDNPYQNILLEGRISLIVLGNGDGSNRIDIEITTHGVSCLELRVTNNGDAQGPWLLVVGGGNQGLWWTQSLILEVTVRQHFGGCDCAPMPNRKSEQRSKWDVPTKTRQRLLGHWDTMYNNTGIQQMLKTLGIAGFEPFGRGTTPHEPS